MQGNRQLAMGSGRFAPLPARRPIAYCLLPIAYLATIVTRNTCAGGSLVSHGRFCSMTI